MMIFSSYLGPTKSGHNDKVEKHYFVLMNGSRQGSIVKGTVSVIFVNLILLLCL